MKFILDTTAYSEFFRGDVRLKKWFTADNDIIIPLIVVGELRAGFTAGSQTDKNEQLLQKFLASPRVMTATITNETTKLFAEIYLKVRKAGTPIGTNDLWISSVALELKIPLLTFDKDFSRVGGLQIISVA